jgi:peptidoglycan/xylan/chitin deacetylase (PgdA/CDA1 family)
VKSNSRKLTLTFDNGPDPIVTPRVLDLLAQRRLPATFLPVGERLEAESQRALMDRARTEGHRIGNHTYSHPRPFGALEGDAAVGEITRTDALLGDLREPDRCFRPSAGAGVLRPGVLNQAAVDHLVCNRHTLVLWNVICEDWRRPDGSWIELAIAEMDKHAWSLIVLHDIDTGGMGHLETFLDRIADAGIEIVADFPDDCVTIRNGEILRPVDHLI